MKSSRTGPPLRSVPTETVAAPGQRRHEPPRLIRRRIADPPQQRLLLSSSPKGLREPLTNRRSDPRLPGERQGPDTVGKRHLGGVCGNHSQQSLDDASGCSPGPAPLGRTTGRSPDRRTAFTAKTINRGRRWPAAPRGSPGGCAAGKPWSRPGSHGDLAGADVAPGVALLCAAERRLVLEGVDVSPYALTR